MISFNIASVWNINNSDSKYPTIMDNNYKGLSRDEFE